MNETIAIHSYSGTTISFPGDFITIFVKVVLAIYYSVVSLTFPIDLGPLVILAYGICAIAYVFIKKRYILKVDFTEDLYE